LFYFITNVIKKRYIAKTKTLFGMGLPIYEINTEDALGIDEVAFTSNPAIKVKGLAFNSHKRLFFSDDVKMRVTAPAMMPMEIYRNQDGEEFYVKFTDEQIELIFKDLMKRTREGNLFNFEHDKGKKVDAYILEAWIVENEATDKANTLYNLDVPKGTIMLTTQIENEADYKEIIDNGRVGYSIGGKFNLKEQQFNNQMNMSEMKEGEKFIFKDGQLVRFEEVEETTEASTEEEPKEEAKEEVELAEEEAPAEPAEEPTKEEAPPALTEDVVAKMIDEKVNEVLNVIAEIKAQIEGEKTEAVQEEEEEEQVQLSAIERLIKLNQQVNNRK